MTREQMPKENAVGKNYVKSGVGSGLKATDPNKEGCNKQKKTENNFT